MRSRTFSTSASPWVAGAGLATAALYLSLLGWHSHKTRAPDGVDCTGPYDAWQVIAFVGGLALVAGFAGWRGHGTAAVFAATVCLVLLWSFDAATVDDPCAEGESLWPIGAVVLVAASLTGLGAVAGLARWSSTVLARRRG